MSDPLLAVVEVLERIVEDVLVASVEVELHAFSVFCEFVDPGVLGRQEIKPVIQYLGGELSQTGQSLKRVLRGTFLVLGICDSEKKCS